jgi:hypothetical protein
MVCCENKNLIKYPIIAKFKYQISAFIQYQGSEVLGSGVLWFWFLDDGAGCRSLVSGSRSLRRATFGLSPSAVSSAPNCSSQRQSIRGLPYPSDFI